MLCWKISPRLFAPSPNEAESPSAYPVRRNEQSDTKAFTPSLSKGTVDCDHSNVELVACKVPAPWLNLSTVSAALMPAVPSTYLSKQISKLISN